MSGVKCSSPGSVQDRYERVRDEFRDSVPKFIAETGVDSWHKLRRSLELFDDNIRTFLTHETTTAPAPGDLMVRDFAARPTPH